jgi:hypothetical protein
VVRENAGVLRLIPFTFDLRGFGTDRSSHAFTRNLGSTMSCMSCLVDLYNSLICAHKKEYYELHGNNNSYNDRGVVS